MTEIDLLAVDRVLVRQMHELGELFGFETRNKYQISNQEGLLMGFAAEQQKGILGFLFRQYLGHWRRFDVNFFDSSRNVVMVGHHPFRWYFERIEVRYADGRPIGAVQKRFAFFTKRFDVENSQGQVILEVASPLWRIWTFTFTNRGRRVAEVKKKWAGLLSEGLTDKDNFAVEFGDPNMTGPDRMLILASAVFIDLLYFERKA